VAKWKVEREAERSLATLGLQDAPRFSVPRPFNILLWRVVAKADDDSYIETVRSVFDKGPSESLRRPLNTPLADALSDSSRLAGLRWFTDNWLRYDNIGGRLVVTDLRMGLGGGFYSFRFEMARHTGQGNGWNAISPVYWPSLRGTENLQAVIRRAWQATPPLPLALWEKNMTRMPSPAALP
jgi:inner membrane protein